MFNRFAQNIAKKVRSKSLICRYSLLEQQQLQHLRKHFCTTRMAEIAAEEMEFDVVIVGGGPAGLSAAIRLKQLAQESDTDLEVYLIEKGAEIGSHIMSGNVFDPIALNELTPDWKEKGAPLKQQVSNDEFWLMTESNKISSPYLPSMMRNDGNYIISLSDLCRWLGEEAESLDVVLLPGFSASQPLYNESGTAMKGVATSDLGLLRDGSMGPNFERGAQLIARQTILAEGCRGSISEEVMSYFDLRNECDAQIYGIGFKEVWQIAADNAHYNAGHVIHAMGYPLPSDVYGGNFIYHGADRQVLIGCVIGLEYSNPFLSPYHEFQKLKHHPEIRKLLEGAECIGYGARALNEGGYQSVPKLSFPGGVLVGCSAGFVNVAKVKGSHYAMKSGILAAENIFNALKQEIDNGVEIKQSRVPNMFSYDSAVRESFIMKDLYKVRNVKTAYNYGRIAGLLHSAFSTAISGGSEPWTLRNGYTCSEKTKPKSECAEIKYDKADNVLTFDILSNLQRTNTYHTDTEPSHLKIKAELSQFAESESYDVYGGPEARFCPAKVYEFIEDTEHNEDGKMKMKMKLVINSQNCIHCKSCSIKAPKEYIQWTVPHGGGGPKYAGM